MFLTVLQLWYWPGETGEYTSNVRREMVIAFRLEIHAYRIYDKTEQ